ncbi:MAG: hypothetical protein M9916_09095 [Crocinitomicaceae bacterium]|nr:hypothetical protein [Crocinitomicaceae bacterium]
MQLLNNKNSFFLILGATLISSLLFHFIAVEPTCDARIVYAVAEDDIEAIDTAWQPQYQNTIDYKAYILTYTNSYYNTDDTSSKHIELAIKTNNANSLEKIAQKYIEDQHFKPNKNFSQVRINIRQNERPWNKTIGVFILVFLLLSFAKLMIKRRKQS